MKNLTIIVALAIGLLITACGTTRKVYIDTNTYIVTAIDSTNQYEDSQNPGTFKRAYDTIFVQVINKANYTKGKYSTTHKIIKTSNSCPK